MTKKDRRWGKITIVIISIIGFIGLSFQAISQEEAVREFSSNTKKATIIYAADLPVINDKQSGDYAQLATLLKEHRQQPTSTFFLFGGRSIGPSPMAVFDRGSHIIDILNSLEPDAYSVANREFSYFEDELSLRAFEAAFPMVASNLTDSLTQKNLEGLVDYAVIQKGDVRIGVISALHESVIEEYRLNRIVIKDPVNAITDVANKLRRENVDVVILLYPYTFDFFEAEDSINMIEQLHKDNVIDVSLSADPDISLANLTSSVEHPNNVFLDKAGQVAVIDLTLEKGKQGKTDVNIQWEEQFLRNIPSEENVKRQVEGYSNRLDRLLGEELGVVTTELDTTRLTVRTKENAFGNFVVDAVRRYAGADIGLINGGVIRGEKHYSPNTTLTRRDIAIELPFRSHVVVTEVSGKQLWNAIENGLSTVEEVKGRFPLVSGLSVQYDSSKQPGSRVGSILVEGKPLEFGKSYSLATTDYLVEGGDGYSSLVDSTGYDKKKSVVPLVSDIVINEIRLHGRISPVVENRIVDNSPENAE